MTTYDPREDDDMLAAYIDDATAAAEHAELCCDLPENYDDPTEFVTLDPMPFAVYGTLRPGCGAASLWRGLAAPMPDPLIVPGFRLITHGPYPFAIPTGDPADSIVVTLIVPHSQVSADVLAGRLDAYEGVPHLYRRGTVNAYEAMTSRAYRAWLYEPAYPQDRPGMLTIPSGDWLTYLAERGL